MKKIILVFIMMTLFVLNAEARNVEVKHFNNWSIAEYYPIYLKTQKSTLTKGFTNSTITEEEALISLTISSYLYGMLQTFSLIASKEENLCLGNSQKEIINNIMYEYKIGKIDGRSKLWIEVLMKVLECRKTNLVKIYDYIIENVKPK